MIIIMLVGQSELYSKLNKIMAECYFSYNIYSTVCYAVGIMKSNFWTNFKTICPSQGHQNVNWTILFVWIVVTFG